jgi:hypothetical protein
MSEIIHTDRVVWRETEPGKETEPLAVPVIEVPIIPNIYSLWYAELDGQRIQIEPTETYSDFFLRV